MQQRDSTKPYLQHGWEETKKELTSQLGQKKVKSFQNHEMITVQSGKINNKTKKLIKTKYRTTK